MTRSFDMRLWRAMRNSEVKRLVGFDRDPILRVGYEDFDGR
jgi:hypothetical protein